MGNNRAKEKMYKHTAKGFLVGTFNENEVRNGDDKKAVEKAKAETGCKYVNTEFVRKGGKIAGVKVYVCTYEEMKL